MNIRIRTGALEAAESQRPARYTFKYGVNDHSAPAVAERAKNFSLRTPNYESAFTYSELYPPPPLSELEFSDLLGVLNTSLTGSHDTAREFSETVTAEKEQRLQILSTSNTYSRFLTAAIGAAKKHLDEIERAARVSLHRAMEDKDRVEITESLRRKHELDQAVTSFKENFIQTLKERIERALLRSRFGFEEILGVNVDLNPKSREIAVRFLPDSPGAKIKQYREQAENDLTKCGQRIEELKRTIKLLLMYEDRVESGVFSILQAKDF